MKIIAPLFLFGLLSSYSAFAQREPSPEEVAFLNRAMSQINAKHVQWIKSTAKEASQRNMTIEDIQGKARLYGRPMGMNEQSFEAITSLAGMLMANDKLADLKSLKSSLELLKSQKEQIKAAMAALDDKSLPITRPQLDSFKLLLKPQQNFQRTNNVSSGRVITQIEINETRTRLSDQRDSLNELGEVQQLRMQMMMDRYQKIMETLSNLMKKIARTQDTIIANLK